MPVAYPGDKQYSKWMGLAYIFNLIVGTGALTLPAAFSRAGWALAAGVIVVLAFISYVTVTFVVEAMASANALLQRKRLQERNVSIRASHLQENDNDSEDTPLVCSDISDHNSDELVHQCDITEQIEMGQMASLFLSKGGRILFYLCIIVYLYGDLSIYCAAVAQSVADVTCSYLPAESNCNSTLPEETLCWEGMKLSRKDAYRIYLGIFIMLLGPFAFFNVQKTKYLQIISTLMRWLAFSIMTGYAVREIVMERDNQEVSHPPAVSFTGIPALFGACVYSFMCHHSIPALVTPIADKSRLSWGFALDYVMIATFYLLLALTGVFAFYPNLHDLYTLDFWQPRGCGVRPGIPPPFIGYFLALFPVFTLSASFPVVAVTLRGNLEALILPPKPSPPSPSEVGVSRLARRLLVPLVAVAPPGIVAFATEDLGTLVGVTGSFAGAGVQYVLPAILVSAARKELVRQNNGEKLPFHKFSSPFRGMPWVAFVLVWALACVLIVTIRLAEQL
ncbi:transmembrane protein 104 homolog [Hetaerina americana]|uniref:transmembrane protein 104 homolog n=1 Tax=Hetaerina americana TaxID=62018 RepID=UPI003A7F43C2